MCTYMTVRCEKKNPTKKSTRKNSAVIYFDIFTISTSDCDLKMRTLIKNWFFCTKNKTFFKNYNAIS